MLIPKFDTITKKNINVEKKKSSKTYEYCPNCGSNQITNSSFCAVCGKSLKIWGSGLGHEG